MFKFPYTNFQELNLDWIIKKVKELSAQIESDSSVVSEYISRLLAVEEKADNAEATANAAYTRATGANTTANSALTLATQAKRTADTATTNVNLLTLKLGDLSSLYTTAKDSIVNAVNEIWSIFHNARAVTNVMPAGTDPAVTYSNGVFTFDLPEGGDPDAITQADLDAAIDGVEDTIDALSDRMDGLEDSIDELSEELDNKADVIIDTASGDIVEFPDGTASPLKSLVVYMKPVQAGTGTPSPNNVRPLSGWNGVVVNIGNSNQILTTIVQGCLTVSGQTFGASYAVRTAFVPVDSNKEYAIKANTNPSGIKIRAFTYATDQSNPQASAPEVSANSNVVRITTGENDKYIKICIERIDQSETISPADVSSVYVTEYSKTALAVFGSEILGGNVDLISGNVVSELEKNTPSAVSYGAYQTLGQFFPWIKFPQLTPSSELFCNILPVVDYSNFLNSSTPCLMARSGAYVIKPFGVSYTNETDAIDAGNLFLSQNSLEVIIPSEVPTQIAITPQEITALSGYNTIWSDAGAVEVTYKADTKGYIDKLIAQVQALALGG